MKTCFKCSRSLPYTEFYRHAKMADGYLSKCKTCTKADVATNRKNNLAAAREYDRERGKLAHRRMAKVDGQRRRRREGRVKRRSPQQARCAAAVQYALQVGKLVRPDRCSRCAVPCKPQAHHDDHSKPLDVMWFCPTCHARRHVELGRVVRKPL